MSVSHSNSAALPHTRHTEELLISEWLHFMGLSSLQAQACLSLNRDYSQECWLNVVPTHHPNHTSSVQVVSHVLTL